MQTLKSLLLKDGAVINYNGHHSKPASWCVSNELQHLALLLVSHAKGYLQVQQHNSNISYHTELTIKSSSFLLVSMVHLNDQLERNLRRELFLPSYKTPYRRDSY